MYCLTMIKTMQERIIQQVKARYFCHQDNGNDSALSTKGTLTGTSKMSTSKKGGTFTVTKKEDKEEDIFPLPTYKDYLCENEVISLNVGGYS